MPAETVPAEPNPLTRLSESDLRGRSSMKWRTHPADVLPLWVAEMDVPLAEPVAQVLRDAVAAGDTGYPFGTGYAEAVVGFADARWGAHGFDVRRSALVPDVMLGIVEVLRLVSGPGDAVVVCPPVYPPFYAFLTHADRRVIEAPLTAAGRLDPAAVDDALGAAGRSSPHPVVLLANPHNPTGTAHTREELTAVAAVANRHGARVVVDEIHAPLALPGASFVPYLSVPGSAGAFSLVSASKGWNLAGLKAALVFAGPDAAVDLARMPEEVGHGASHLGVLAHTAAFRDGGSWLDALLAGLDDNRTRLAHQLEALLPRLGYLPPQATYLAWLDCRALAQHDDEVEPDPAAPGVVTDLAGPARFFLDEARVALSSGHVFGRGGTGHVRLNFATSPAILDDALERMSAAVTRIGPASA